MFATSSLKTTEQVKNFVSHECRGRSDRELQKNGGRFFVRLFCKLLHIGY